MGQKKKKKKNHHYHHHHHQRQLGPGYVSLKNSGNRIQMRLNFINIDDNSLHRAIITAANTAKEGRVIGKAEGMR